MAEIFYLAITTDGHMALYKSIEALALDGDSMEVQTTLAVSIDIAAAQKMNNTAAEAMLDLFNLRGETDITRAPAFALRYLREEFEESAIHNAKEAKRLAKAERDHERQELSNLHTL